MEFGIAGLDWPTAEGTAAVLAAGFRVVLDREGLLNGLREEDVGEPPINRAIQPGRLTTLPNSQQLPSGPPTSNLRNITT